MSQHDFNIANQTFPTTRADINNALEALASVSSGASAPSTTRAYMFWYDTTTDKLKQRNADDDAWITLFTFDQATDSVQVSGEELVDDTSPQLGGNLDVQTHSIVSTSNRDITLDPNGTGNVVLGNYEFDVDQTVGASQDDYVLTYNNSTGHISLEEATGGGAGAVGGGSDEIFWENGQNVTTNYTITNGKNAMSAGPITINTGVTVTVGTGETWTVV